MTKKEKLALQELSERCRRSERKAELFDSLAIMLFEAMKSDIEELVREEIESTVDDLQISR